MEITHIATSISPINSHVPLIMIDVTRVRTNLLSIRPKLLPGSAFTSVLTEFTNIAASIYDVSANVTTIFT
jgi:hypothetical protein